MVYKLNLRAMTAPFYVELEARDVVKKMLMMSISGPCGLEKAFNKDQNTPGHPIHSQRNK